MCRKCRKSEGFEACEEGVREAMVDQKTPEATCALKVVLQEGLREPGADQRTPEAICVLTVVLQEGVIHKFHE